MSKFAPMTAGLLARKGEAFPSAFFSMPPPSLVSLEANDAAPQQRTQTPGPAALPAADRSSEMPRVRHHEIERPHKLRVALSDAEFQKLGLAAVKHSVSRHQLIREALDSYVDRLIEAYRGNCRCIGGEGTCGNATTPCGSL